MKILVNALSARRGGIVTYTRNLMISFKERGVDAIFALPNDSTVDVDVERIHLPVADMWPMTRAVWEQMRWRAMVKKIRPDVLYSSANFGLLAPPVPQVLLIREGGLFDPVYLAEIAPSLGTDSVIGRLLRRKLILASAWHSDLVLTPTDAMRELLSLWDTELAGRIKTNLYGTRLEHFKSDVPHPPLKRNSAPLKLLLVSAYYPHKQPGLVAEAVRLLNEAGFPCSLSITMDLTNVTTMTGHAKDEILIRKGVERGEVELLGQIDYGALPSLYRDHDVFVTASLSETFGHPLVEAMASGIPIVAADTPVHREVCSDCATYFDGTSAVGLSNAIRKAVSDAETNVDLGQRMQSRSREIFSWGAHVDRLLENLESVARSRR